MHPLRTSFAYILCVHPLLPWVAKVFINLHVAEHRTYHAEHRKVFIGVAWHGRPKRVAEHRKVFIGVGVGVGVGVGAKGHGHRHRDRRPKRVGMHRTHRVHVTVTRAPFARVHGARSTEGRSRNKQSKTSCLSNSLVVRAKH